jgi:hypothetical protein
LLGEAIEHTEWQKRYSCWYRGVAAQAARTALLDAELPTAACLDAAGARSALCNAFRMRIGIPVGTLLRQMRAPIHALASAHIQHELGDFRLADHPRPGLCLVTDLAGLLQWSGYGLLASAEPDRLRTAGSRRCAAVLVETASERLKADMGAILERFELWLRNWVL